VEHVDSWLHAWLHVCRTGSTGTTPDPELETATCHGPWPMAHVPAEAPAEAPAAAPAVGVIYPSAVLHPRHAISEIVVPPVF
jgi:hypothetical protein